MRSIYDNVDAADSADPSTLSGSTPVVGAAVDTEGYNTAMLRVRALQTSSNPSVATITFKLQECATSGGSYTDALDNTGTVIGGVLDVHAANADGLARIEGLGTSRKRYLKVVLTPAFTGGTSPAIVAFGEILMGRGFQRPSNTATSNT